LEDSITVTDVSIPADTAIYRLYLTILHTESAIKNKKIIVGSSSEAQSYLPIQKIDYSGSQNDASLTKNFEVEMTANKND